jgi:eukaryotic-like serine/threonine-protein kinase
MTAEVCLGIQTMVDLCEGRADPATRALVEAHASRCAECRRVLSSLARDGLEPGAAGAQAPPAPPAPPGRALEDPASVGRYQIERLLGSGGMGVVFAAHDPELDRRVAIKLLRPDLGHAASRVRMQERLRREAQAMAQLAHPNVVAVHDVGLFHERIFIAMEYIDGETLARWLAATARRPREILEVFAAAGRGLAAAHTAGLVHRDFKPENVLVGNDGRVRVVDFGLARTAGDEDVPATVGATAPVSGDAPTVPAGLTASGTMLGTPYYMAPEQYRGEPVDARTDQFSFCVALHTALYGVRPFAGHSVSELAQAVQAGRIVEPTRGPRVSRAVRRAIRRGLSSRPDDRFPSMDALLAAIAAPRQRWLVIGAPSALAVAAIAIAVAVSAGREAAPPCQRATEHLRGVWDEPRKATIRLAFARTGVPYAASSYTEVARVADRYAGAWVAMRTEACEATRVHGEQTEDMLGLRMVCLDGRLRHLGALANQLSSADRVVAEHAVTAIHALPPLEVCADAEALASPIRPPADPITRARVAAVRGRLAEIRALGDAGLIQRARAESAGLIDSVRALGYRPVEAEALELAGDLAERAGDFAAAETALRDAALAAEAGRHDRLLASALTEMIVVVGYQQARPADAEPLRRRADAALERIARPPELEVEMLEALGMVALTAGDYPEARRRFEAEVAQIERLHGRDDIRLVKPLKGLGQIHLNEDHGGDALPLFERMLAITRRIYSDDHPAVAGALEAVAAARFASAQYDEAEASYLRAQHINERVYGRDSIPVANVMGNLADVYAWQGKPDEAIGLLRRVIAIEEAGLGREHPTTLSHLQSLASTLETLSRYPEATAILERVGEALRRRLGDDHPQIAGNLGMLAVVKLADGKPAEALELAQQSFEMSRRTLGDRYRPLAELRTSGAAYLRLGQPGKAVDALVAARASLSDDDDPGERAWIEGLLGRALVESGRDAARGRALVIAAWNHVRADDRMDDQRAELTAWMRARRMPVAAKP